MASGDMSFENVDGRMPAYTKSLPISHRLKWEHEKKVGFIPSCCVFVEGTCTISLILLKRQDTRPSINWLTCKRPTSTPRLTRSVINTLNVVGMWTNWLGRFVPSQFGLNCIRSSSIATLTTSQFGPLPRVNSDFFLGTNRTSRYVFRWQFRPFSLAISEHPVLHISSYPFAVYR